MTTPDSPVIAAIRSGDFPATMRVIEADRSGVLKQRKDVAALYRAISAAPYQSRSPEHLWDGELEAHVECVTAAHMICIGAERAAKLIGVSRPFASKQIPILFPDELPVFAETWAQLYQRSPKHWDRIAHYPAMFDWVRRGLIGPPVANGAVNLLLSHLVTLRKPMKFLRETPGLIEVTLPLLFDAEVRPSVGAAAVDSNIWSEDPVRIDRIIVALVTEGYWQRDMVAESIARARAARPSPFQRRWLSGLSMLVGLDKYQR